MMANGNQVGQLHCEFTGFNPEMTVKRTAPFWANAIGQSTSDACIQWDRL